MKFRFVTFLTVLSLFAVSSLSVYSSAMDKNRKLEPYAFYESCKAYYEETVSRNWKDRGKALEKIRKDAEVYDEPMVSWQLAREGLLDRIDLKSFIQTHRYRLLSASHKEFHKKDDADYPGFVMGSIANDYEYVLWMSLNDKDGMELLRDHYAGTYPFEAYIEYCGIIRNTGNRYRYYWLSDWQKSALHEFALKHDGKAVALFAERDLLVQEKGSLKTSDEFRAYRQKCAGFEKRRASYKGQEAKIAESCTGIDEVIRELDSEAICQSCNGDTVVVSLRNLDGAEVEIWKENEYGKDGTRPIWRTGLRNAVGSYYVYDTLKAAFPPIDDGNYTVVCRNGKTVSEGWLSRHSVSIAGRDYEVYAADARSGRPVVKADLTVQYKGEVQKVVEGFLFDGFTDLPHEVVELIESNDGQTVVSCSYTDENGLLRQNDITLSKRTGRATVRKDMEDAEIYLDRAAYNPGDTVRFKVVMYTVGADGRMSAVQAGRKFSVNVSDVTGKVFATMELVTNEFGAAAGEAVIPGFLERNGRCSLSVDCGGRNLDTAYFMADEFVLPTYTVEFEKDDAYHLPGDTIIVKGQIKSWSGHPLSSADVSYRIAYGDFSREGELEVGTDGSFEITFRSNDNDPADYRVEVKVVDLTGEAKEAFRYVRVQSHLYVSAEMEDEADGRIEYVADDRLPFDWNGSSSVMKGDTARIRFNVHSVFGANVVKEVDYRVLDGKRTLMKGKTETGKYVTIDLSGLPSGVYTVEAESSYTSGDGKVHVIGYIKKLVRAATSDEVFMTPGVRNLFVKADGGRVGALVGATDGPVWAIAELYDDKGNVLQSDRIYLDGRAGEKGSLRLVDYEYRDEYPDAVSFRIFYFKDESRYDYMVSFNRPQPSHDLPLEFVSFTDRSMPGALTHYRIRTLPGVECLVSVFDKSTESMMRNVWQKILHRQPQVQWTYIRSHIGNTVLFPVSGMNALDDMVAVGYGKSSRSMGAVPFQMAESKPMLSKAMSLIASEEEVAMDTFAGDIADADAGVAVRDDFRNTVAFLPFLRSDEDGLIDFSVVPSGKLSTYIVSLFAHDKEMRNSLLRREMTVTMPVKVSVMEPGFLYEGDRYRLKASVSNVIDRSVDGTLALYVYDNKDYKVSEPVMVKSSRVVVAPGRAVAEEFEVKVPSGTDVLGFKVVFTGKAEGTDVSDGLFVDVPVKPASQVLVEAHSAVLSDASEKMALTDSLEKAFVNISAMGAEYKEISLKDMLMETLPEKVEAEGMDVLSYSEAYYVNRLLGETGHVRADSVLMKDLMDKIRDCQNADGGFGWFAGMKSSSYITAVILERARRTGELLDEGQVRNAVGYLDACQFGDGHDWGRLSLGQYLSVRSLYAEVPFDVNLGKKEAAAFCKEVKEWLRPKNDGAEKHNILARARRASVKLNLAAPEAAALRKSWKSGSSKSLLRSVKEEVTVLAEYAVKHPSGGYYFPNAVMPFRGLLESELYAHVMLCNLFCRVGDNDAVGFDAWKAYSLADGLRLWMMIQKETQKWDSDPAYIDAVVTVLDGPEEVLETKVLTLTKRYLKPFADINESGNGLRISRKYYKVSEGKVLPAGGYKKEDALKEGDILNVGDRIVAVYEVWSRENRSFVRIAAPHCASLRPVQQLSGILGWGFRPVQYNGRFTIYPQGYRNVRTDCTELYFDVLPEEMTSFTEEFYVTQAGVFTSPVAVVESLYAPHYRANEAFPGLMRSE